ncbi:oligosaccharide flippase family protein [Porticoccus sp. W117]|uniref:oligosaccharide flippase family protein n=1 Tax=Porticoccus sp. W117 TaxID=3054777 RepID=UPI0025946259|nr:oligosaccharide flippase family protein [Porticoccus sp. W117]MDM3870622.1 oligosaccharide flippase family protein [Porticoccus sp. W117]
MKDVLNTNRRALSDIYRRASSLASTSLANSAFWVFVGSGGYQVIRLLGNLVLTRLLFPEVFGVMAIVTAVMIGLGQLSDVGLRQGVVNSDRVNDPRFMQTAWTLQIVRAGFIGLLGIAIAYPIASFYDASIIAPVLIWIALSALITGFKSIAPLAYDKRLDLKTQMLVDLGIQVLGLAVVIVWAYISPTLWALVAGQVVSSVLEVITSYYLFSGHHSRFAWDKEVVKKLFNFGKWILLSSIISYLAVQGDRLILGAFLSMGELGKYSVAATWAAITSLFSVNISTRVLHPYFKKAIDNHSDYGKIYRVRNLLNVLYVGICIVLAAVGDHLIYFLYDDRYSDAGWMLQILAVGQVGRALTGTLMPFMIASGDSFSQMKFSTANAVILIASLLLGGYLAGTVGIVVAITISSLLAHPVMIAYANRHGYRCFLSDMSLIVFSVLICIALWWLMDSSVINVLFK